ncbi:MAG: hypothetical protein HYZ13_11100 [Acidobacteria bacterium]|nr:hypothetical protein [Acidobacteriota bacterium]
MIAPLLLAAGFGIQAPPQAQEGLFATPRIYTMSFEEAMKPPRLPAPGQSPIQVHWRPLPRNRAGDWWLGFGLQLLTGQSFQRWEQDPQVLRRSEFAATSASLHP